MKRLKLTVRLAFIAACLLAHTPQFTNAQECEDPCDPCGRSFCDLDIEIAIDFLWWKPCVDDLDYAAELKTNTPPFVYKMKSIHPDWEPGVRVMVALPDLYCSWDLKASYTYIKSEDSSHVEEENAIVLAISHPGVPVAFLSNEGKGEWEACYHEWDVLLSYDILLNECYSVTTLFGVAGIVLDQEFEAKITIEDSISFTKWNSDYWGVGFRLGTDYRYRFSDCLELFVKGTATILAGDADSKYESDGPEEDETDEIIVKDDHPCQIVCGYHIGAGILYETSLCNYDSFIKLGYEYIQWHNLPNHRTFVSTRIDGGPAAVSASSNTRTFGFHGLMAGVAVAF